MKESGMVTVNPTFAISKRTRQFFETAGLKSQQMMKF